MSNKVILEICKLQSVKPQTYVPVRCPNCNNRTLFMGVKSSKGVCTTCNDEYSESEVLMQSEEDFRDEEKYFDRMMRNNRGSGNY